MTAPASTSTRRHRGGVALILVGLLGSFLLVGFLSVEFSGAITQAELNDIANDRRAAAAGPPVPASATDTRQMLASIRDELGTGTERLERLQFRSGPRWTAWVVRGPDDDEPGRSAFPGYGPRVRPPGPAPGAGRRRSRERLPHRVAGGAIEVGCGADRRPLPLVRRDPGPLPRTAPRHRSHHLRRRAPRPVRDRAPGEAPGHPPLPELRVPGLVPVDRRRAGRALDLPGRAAARPLHVLASGGAVVAWTNLVARRRAVTRATSLPEAGTGPIS